MKNISIVIACLLAAYSQAQKPETVYSVAREQREISWYEQQEKLWKQETVKNKSNASAWYNYYSAVRALRNSYYDDQNPEAAEKKRAQYTEQGHKIVEDAYKAVPKSFEANHMKWWDGGNRDEMLPFLMKAYEISPNDARAYDDLMIHYEITRNKPEFDKFCQKIFDANDLAASLLNWGYNVLSELDERAVLFTVGDNDTYATWVMQGAKNFRKDVTVINTSLILMDNYRNKLFADIGLPPLNLTLDNLKSEQDYSDRIRQIYDHILKNTRGIPVYVSASGIASFEEMYAENLFLTGLAYKYSAESFDNISLIRRNYEKRYLLDYLQQNFSFNIMNKHAETFDATYLPSMLKLYRHYEQSEETAKMRELEAMLVRIGKTSVREKEIEDFMKNKK